MAENYGELDLTPHIGDTVGSSSVKIQANFEKLPLRPSVDTNTSLPADDPDGHLRFVEDEDIIYRSNGDGSFNRLKSDVSDEVVESRGTKAFISERLNESLNNDGTLKPLKFSGVLPFSGSVVNINVGETIETNDVILISVENTNIPYSYIRSETMITVTFDSTATGTINYLILRI